MLRYCLLFLLCLNAGGVWAQDASSTSPITVGGFVDGYYAFEFTRPPSGDRSFTTQPLRHNEFNINLALIEVRYDADRAHGRFGLQAGTYVESNYGVEPAALQRLHEAYMGFRLGRSAWWVDMGLLGSHIGFEAAISKDNWAYSRSIMADFSPFFETGIRLSGPLSEKATFAVVLVNGWQNIRETNDDKAIGTQLQLQPNDGLLFNWSTFTGNEMPDSQPWQPRIFNNFFI